MIQKAENETTIFIPFIEGNLNCECRTCNYNCCRKGGIALNIEEKEILFKRSPFLKYGFLERGKRKNEYILCRYSTCYLLESNGLCSYQKKYGYFSKPFTCRIHPFYVNKCQDGYVVIPQGCRNLCVDKKNNSKDSSYRRVLKNAYEAIDNNDNITSINLPTGRLNLEKDILAGLKEFINRSNYLDFSAYQVRLTGKNANMANIKSKLMESVKLWKTFLSIDDLNVNNKLLTYELTVITPILRLKNSYLRCMQTNKVPLALLALYFCMILLSKDRKTKAHMETYEQILSDIALGLLHLKKDDLSIKNRSIEDKINYLHKLRNLYIKLMFVKVNLNKG